MPAIRKEAIRPGVGLKVATLHHVAVTTRDLARSMAFYEGVLGLRPLPRPAFAVGGAWYEAGPLEVHVVEHDGGSYRTRPEVDANDIHFALRVEDFEAAVTWLVGKGYREGMLDDPMGLLVKRGSVAGYHQAYLMDPDGHLLEINAAP